MHQTFAARQGVAKLPAGRQRGRPGGEDLQLWENVSADFQEPGGIAELVDFIEDHDRLRAGAEEKLWIAHHVLDAGQIAVDVEDAVHSQALGQSGLAATTNAAEPGDGRLAPRGFDAFQPERSCDHDIEVYAPSYQT